MNNIEKPAFQSREKPPIHRPTFLLLLGPSATGKSTLIREAQKIDDRLKMVSPIMDRPLRDGETDKTSVSKEAFDELERQGTFLIVNSLYGYRYGTPKTTVEFILKENKIPVLDFPLEKVPDLNIPADLLYKVYVLPPSFGTLTQRVTADNRDRDGSRLKAGKDEINMLRQTRFEHPDIDDAIVNGSLPRATENLLKLLYQRISGI